MNIRLPGPPPGGPSPFLDREWLDTNGRGGYACSTLLGCHTRRYHGLLVANLPPPQSGRHILLSACDETLSTPAADYPLGTHAFPGGLFPRDAVPPAVFSLGRGPAWNYRCGPWTLTRTLYLLHHRDTVVLRYTLAGPDAAAPLRLRLRPLLAFRRHHALTHANDAIRPGIVRVPDGLRLRPYDGMPPLFLNWSLVPHLHVQDEGHWHRDFEYRHDEQRGYEFREDLFAPLSLDVSLQPGRSFVLAAGTEELPAPDAAWAAEDARRAAAARSATAFCRPLCPPASSPAVVERLVLAAATFPITTPGGRPALLAGYPWFEDWGRDTMIALPGLLFHTGRHAAGLDLLQAFVAQERDGLLPNFVNPDGTAAYNSADASLWFFWTVQQYLATGGTLEEVRTRCWPALRRILDRYAAGIPELPVRLTRDGLLWTGRPDTQLTWMDAHADGHPVTPRWGLAVEINALWHNALAFAADCAARLGESDYRPPVPPEQVAAAFRSTFWLPADEYLADLVNEAGIDRAVRPNQIFAVSLPHSPLHRPQQEAVVNRVQAELLTPFGLRTLSPRDPRYRGRYAGPMPERDRAYHQGTAWPWLLGPFVEAVLRTRPHDRTLLNTVAAWLEPWQAHLSAAGIGTVSEVFDGDPPHAPEGCIAQAWSVAELLRAHLLLWQAQRACRG